MRKTSILGILGQNGQFWTVFGQNGQNGNFVQKSAWNIFSQLKALTNGKVSEKSNEGRDSEKNAKNLHFGHFGPKWPILDSFWLKWAKREFFSKKRLENFFVLTSPN